MIDYITFAEVFDVLFKIQKKIDMNFDKPIASAMFFTQCFIYKMQDSQQKPTPRMEDIYNRLTRDISNTIQED